MFGFKKKKKVYPPFPRLTEFAHKDKYFLRCAVWDWLDDEMIHVFHTGAPKAFTMDPWPQHIFLSAAGAMTVTEFVFHMADTYSKKEGIPDKLDDTIVDMLTSLVGQGLVEYSDDSRPPKDAFHYPISRGA